MKKEQKKVNRFDIKIVILVLLIVVILILAVFITKQQLTGKIILTENIVTEYVNFTNSSIVNSFTNGKSGYSFSSPNRLVVQCPTGKNGPFAGSESVRKINISSNWASVSITRVWSSVQRSKGPRIEAYVSGVETDSKMIPNGTNWASVQHQPSASLRATLLVRHMNQPTADADQFAGTTYFQPNTPYTIKVVMKLNDIGKSNGIAQLWINDKIEVNRTDLLFRTTSNLKIQEAVHTVYNTFYYTQDTTIFDSDWLVEEMSSSWITRVLPVVSNCIDNDKDGFNLSAGCGVYDCDDNNSNINPLASEICDNQDNNCNNLTNEGLNCSQELCWAGSNKYVKVGTFNHKKFCKCVEGRYGYLNYERIKSRTDAYSYYDAKNTENWETILSTSSYNPTYKIKCLNRIWYSTSEDYYK